MKGLNLTFVISGIIQSDLEDYVIIYVLCPSSLEPRTQSLIFKAHELSRKEAKENKVLCFISLPDIESRKHNWMYYYKTKKWMFDLDSI